jgi:hypothetical protein
MFAYTNPGIKKVVQCITKVQQHVERWLKVIGFVVAKNRCIKIRLRLYTLVILHCLKAHFHSRKFSTDRKFPPNIIV